MNARSTAEFLATFNATVEQPCYMLLHYFTHAAEVTVASTRDAIGLLYSAVDQLLEGDVFSLRKAVRMLLKLVLALFLLVAPSIADIQYLTSSNVTRSYWIHPPDDFQQGHKYPVVIAFHGGSRLGSDADGFAMELDARLSLPLVRTSYSKNKQRYFVYPNGVGGAWAGPTYAEVSVEEDLQFVSDMIADIKSRYSNIDDNRIYAAGMSNGGGFVGTLACSEVGAQFAGFASVASSFYTDVESVDCSPARLPLPMLEIHGGSDKVVPYAGGMGHGGPLPPIPEWYR
ncbi:hypothetical protein UA08_04925 [Talaromyces atroroseus]|uniref:feruloyl esterase n=1 Tax=Talaromyces atroroseus TaxID=1441469 RepID=A0A225AFR8_TALAT|nr:hypothetical protein UA08_04925 [Talaromyces atroroseus]OKL60192.1 hypothetical protein UA08_04925 [Talaromyces atroroseus]